MACAANAVSCVRNHSSLSLFLLYTRCSGSSGKKEGKFKPLLEIGTESGKFGKKSFIEINFRDKPKVGENAKLNCLRVNRTGQNYSPFHSCSYFCFERFIQIFIVLCERVYFR